MKRFFVAIFIIFSLFCVAEATESPVFQRAPDDSFLDAPNLEMLDLDWHNDADKCIRLLTGDVDFWELTSSYPEAHVKASREALQNLSNNSLKQLTKSRKQFSSEDEKLLFDKVSQGDEAAKQLLLYSHLWIIRAVYSKDQFYKYQSVRADFSDFFFYGYIGLIKAIEKYNYNFVSENGHARFSTFAFHYVQRSFLNGIGQMLGITRSNYNHYIQPYIKAIKDNVISNSMSAEVKAKRLNWTIQRVRNSETLLSNIFGGQLSLQAPVYGKSKDDGEAGTIEGSIVDENNNGSYVENEISSLELKRTIYIHLEQVLSPVQRLVIFHKFGLSDDSDLTVLEFREKHKLSDSEYKYSIVLGMDLLKAYFLDNRLTLSDFIDSDQ